MRIVNHGLLAAAIILVPGWALAQSAGGEPGVRVAQAEEEPQGGQNGLEPTVENYARVLLDVADLEDYNALLERQISDQERQLEQLRASIESAPALQRQIPPLLERMVQRLEQFIALDLPFHRELRAESVAELQTLVESPDASVAEKFRRVMEAWQIETEYGRTYEAYRGTLDIEGANRQVDFLRLGRVALIYQTLGDDALTGIWDPNSETWVQLGTQHRNSVRQAMRMARNTLAPDMVVLPVPPPERE